MTNTDKAIRSPEQYREVLTEYRELSESVAPDDVVKAVWEVLEASPYTEDEDGKIVAKTGQVSQSLAELFKFYPNAVKASRENFVVGDVLCNHVQVDALIVTQNVLDNPDMDFDYFYIVARTRQRFERRDTESELYHSNIGMHQLSQSVTP